jgi:hypothetical protein
MSSVRLGWTALERLCRRIKGVKIDDAGATGQHAGRAILHRYSRGAPDICQAWQSILN